MRRSSIRRSLAALALLSGVVAGYMPWAPAHAVASCNSFTSYPVSSGFMRVPTIGRETNAYNCHLGTGNYGSAVRVLQASLIQCQFQNIATDSEFGPRTQQAVRNAQRQLNEWYNANIAVDGSYGPQTRRAGLGFAVFTTYNGWDVNTHEYCRYRIDP